MSSLEARSRPRRSGLPREAPLLAALLLALLLGGCLSDARDADYDFDNPNDTTPPSGDDDDEGGTDIVYVDAFTDVVIIANFAALEQDMDGWRLTNEDQSGTYAFGGFTLGAGSVVRVHSDDGTDDANDLFMEAGSGIDWGNGELNNVAILLDSGDGPVSNCQENDSCWP